MQVDFFHFEPDGLNFQENTTLYHSKRHANVYMRMKPLRLSQGLFYGTTKGSMRFIKRDFDKIELFEKGGLDRNVKTHLNQHKTLSVTFALLLRYF